MKKYYSIKTKPFLKWVGGKTQLLSNISNALPVELVNQKFTYIEPFVGGGAVLFWILNKFPHIEKAIINDVNGDLTNVYAALKNDVTGVINILKQWEAEYHKLGEGSDERKKIYYKRREIYNERSKSLTERAALFIFLNKTCFNGLYRVNSKNLFNVPIGRYKRPMICDEINLNNVSKVLAKVEILTGDFEQTINHAHQNTFFYCDPPYKPIASTSSFTSYTKGKFDDNDQLRIHQFCNNLNTLGCKWMLSNSDVKNEDAANNYFDDLYADYYINRVKAKRSINSNPNKRGKLNELLITNYETFDSVLTLF